MQHFRNIYYCLRIRQLSETVQCAPTFRFELTRSAAIQLKISNPVGQELETLPQQSPVPAVPVPANQWATGIYFYKLQTGYQKLQRKMLLR